MRKSFSLVIVAIAILFSQIAAFGQEEAVKPSYKAGETWQFTAKEGGSIGTRSNSLDGTYELSIVDGKLKIFSVKGEQKDELEPRPAALSGLLGVARNLNFPLAIGKQWTFDYKNAPVGGKPTARKITYEVKAIEEVTTAAGTFRAFKLESDDRGPRDFWTTTYWYSPETRSVVKSLFDGTSAGQFTGQKREIELIKFPPQK